MESIQIIALIVFLITIGFIIWGKLDSTVVGLVGVVLMVLLGVMNESEAFLFVDWNVIAILFSIWSIIIQKYHDIKFVVQENYFLSTRIHVDIIF